VYLGEPSAIGVDTLTLRVRAVVKAIHLSNPTSTVVPASLPDTTITRTRKAAPRTRRAVVMRVIVLPFSLGTNLHPRGRVCQVY
jgi:hypothetical protein